jgi:hypothetical protein
MTPLCDLAFKYGTDKCPQWGHSYTPFYWDLLKDKRESIKKVLEIGIGCPRTMGSVVKGYKTGASLFMWRDFFPNAQIYGVDKDPTAIFQADRIKTFLCDTMNKNNLTDLIEQTGSDIDLFVDDGAHFSYQQVFLCQNIMPLLKKDVIYIIEDVLSTKRVRKALSEYETELPPFIVENKHLGRVRYRDRIVIVKNK